jgi:hypothetical protein
MYKSIQLYRRSNLFGETSWKRIVTHVREQKVKHAVSCLTLSFRYRVISLKKTGFFWSKYRIQQ